MHRFDKKKTRPSLVDCWQPVGSETTSTRVTDPLQSTELKMRLAVAVALTHVMSLEERALSRTQPAPWANVADGASSARPPAAAPRADATHRRRCRSTWASQCRWGRRRLSRSSSRRRQARRRMRRPRPQPGGCAGTWSFTEAVARSLGAGQVRRRAGWPRTGVGAVRGAPAPRAAAFGFVAVSRTCQTALSNRRAQTPGPCPRRSRARSDARCHRPITLRAAAQGRGATEAML